MKRIIIVVVLVLVAGIAGIVRSSSHGGTVGQLKNLVSHDAQADVREEIRKSFDLSSGAIVEINGINGAVKVETADTKTAEVYIDRKASSPDALQRRKIVVEMDGSVLRISSEKGDSGFFARLFSSNGSESVSLKVPREISFRAKGVNGSVTVGE